MGFLRPAARATRAARAPSPPPFSSSEREYSYPLPAGEGGRIQGGYDFSYLGGGSNLQ